MGLVWRIIKRVFGSLFLAVVALVGAPVAGSLTVLAGLIFLPLPATIPVPKPNPTILPTIIYDRYGNQIATLKQFDSNVPVTEAQIPQVLKEAVVADEDRNYYHHGGVDLRGTVRAIYDDVRHSGPLQGGSTITQQYVKLAYLNQQRTLVRKVKEAILAAQLAREASKNEILYRYLTIVYFGDGNYGVGAAAANYFHVPVQKLNASQAATLAGLIPAPSYRAPTTNLASAEAARELVLGKMYQQDYLTKAQYDAALKQKLALVPVGAVAPRGRTAVYPLEPSPTRFPDFVDYVTKWLLAHFPANQVYSGGLRVQTTLDPAIQQDAYDAVNSTLASGGSELAPPADMAMAAVQPQTGFVEALVGGRNFGKAGSPVSQDNLALGGCTPEPGKGANIQVSATCWSGGMISGGTKGRQPGSAWKPFVLATAFEQGIPPTAVYNGPAVYTIPGCKVPTGKPASVCQIHNAEQGALGNMTLATATAQSINTVYAQVAPQVGCPNVAKTARTLGVETAYYAVPGSSAPAGVFYNCSGYALGEVGVSPLDMASAYGVFADHGQKAAPTPILEIVNSSGKVLVNNIHPLPRTTTAIPANIADNVTNVLQTVLTSGTATNAQIGRPAAGKTGTVSNFTDAWFVGYTPTLSAAVWLGNDNGETKIGGPYGFDVFGATYSAPAWKRFMQLALANVPVTPFNKPAPIVTPQAAAALQIGPTTTLPVEPGPPGVVAGTPDGGPYTVPGVPPIAPEPAVSFITTTTLGLPTTTTSPTTTTTLPADTTTTSTSTTSTTFPGFPP